MKKKLLVLATTAACVISMSSTAFAAGRTLSFGKSGDDVLSLQYALQNFGYFWDDPTGYFGEITENALIAFQDDYGLEVDGIAGPITNSYLGVVTDSDDDSSEYSGYSTLYRTLENGMEGDDVYTLQLLLADWGYFYSIPTGFFGDLTEAAVIAFQSDCGLDVDGVAGPATIGTLTGTYSAGSGLSGDALANYQAAVLAAIDYTPTTGSGYCAEWVTQVFSNAGILTYNPCNLRGSYYSYAVTSGLADGWYSDNAGWNANDYWAYVCNSTDLDDLQVGMIVATRSSYTYLGHQFGHVGIYIGNGQVISSVGYLETLSLDEWNRRYNDTSSGSSIAWGFLPY